MQETGMTKDIEVLEVSSYAQWQECMESFKAELQRSPELNERGVMLCDEHERIRINGVQQDAPGTRRFLGKKGQATVGCMILQKNPSDLKIMSIVVDQQNKKGVAKSLVVAAANESLKAGCGGSLTLADVSNGSGSKFYNFMGFRKVDEIKMRLDTPGTGRAATGAHWAYKDTPDKDNLMRGITELVFVEPEKA